MIKNRKATRNQLELERKELWENEDNFCFKNLVPPPKVISVLEVSGDVKSASLSSKYEYMAVINYIKEYTESLYIVNLKEKKVKLLKSFPSATTLIYFVPNQENHLFVGSQCGRIFHFNIEIQSLQILEGHESAPSKVSLSAQSDILVTFSSTEALLWSWPQCVLTKRLKLDQRYTIIEVGHVWQSNVVFAAFDSGAVLIWDREQAMRETVLEAPKGVQMQFKSFSVSTDGEWVVGVGSEALIVIYSIASRRVTQVVHFSHPESLTGLEYVQYLPPVHSKHPETFLIGTSRCIIIVDFLSLAVIKVLKSERHSIKGVCVSGDGSLLGVTYGNGVMKLYTLVSFFPRPAETLKLAKEDSRGVGFTIIKAANESKERKKKTQALFDESKWTEILNEFEKFPSKYRKHIWVSVMRLPRNYSILNAILVKEKKHKFESLEAELPDIRNSVLETLSSTLECLCYWSPFLADVEFLPRFILPFVELFEPNVLFCFETALFIILNWCSSWFAHWPEAPKSFLGLVDSLVCENDADLWIHLKKINLPVERYAWPLLKTSFKPIFSEEDWFIIWDHLLSKPPSFMICICAAFPLCLRQSLLNCSQECQGQELFCRVTWLPVGTILKKANRLHASLDLEEGVRERLSARQFLPEGALMPLDGAHGESDLQGSLYPKANSFDPPISSKLLQVQDSDVLGHKSLFKRSDELKTKPAEMVSMEPKQFSKMEQICLQRIQCTRKKLINFNLPN